MAAAAHVGPQPGVCHICGCSQFDACVDPETGETCGWANAEATLCTFCDEKLRAAAGPPDAREPLIVLATEGECNQYIRTLREGN